MLIEGIGEADFFSMELVEHVLVHPHPAYYLLPLGIHIAHVGLEETIFQDETYNVVFQIEKRIGGGLLSLGHLFRFDHIGQLLLRGLSLLYGLLRGVDYSRWRWGVHPLPQSPFQIHLQRLFRQLEQFGAFAHIECPQHLVVHLRHGFDDSVHHLGAFQRVVARPVHEGFRLELDDIHSVLLQIILQFRVAVSLGKRVGVFAVGQQHGLHVQSGGQQHVDTPQRGLDAGIVAIVQHRDIVGLALNQLDLSVGEGGARRGHHILHTRLRHGNHIGITFHQIHIVALANGTAGEIEAVQHVALVVDGIFGRVVILGAFSLLAHHTATEPDGATESVENREDNSSFIKVK